MAKILRIPKNFHITENTIEERIKTDKYASKIIRDYKMDINELVRILFFINQGVLRDEDRLALKYIAMRRRLPQIIKKYEEAYAGTERLLLPLTDSYYISSSAKICMLDFNFEPLLDQLERLLTYLKTMNEKGMVFWNEQACELTQLKKYESTNRVLRLVRFLSYYFYTLDIKQVNKIADFCQIFISKALPENAIVDSDNIKKLIQRHKIIISIKIVIAAQKQPKNKQFEYLLINLFKHGIYNLTQLTF